MKEKEGLLNRGSSLNGLNTIKMDLAHQSAIEYNYLAKELNKPLKPLDEM